MLFVFYATTTGNIGVFCNKINNYGVVQNKLQQVVWSAISAVSA
jgi:hypothetical protein